MGSAGTVRLTCPLLPNANQAAHAVSMEADRQLHEEGRVAKDTVAAAALMEGLDWAVSSQQPARRGEGERRSRGEGEGGRNMCVQILYRQVHRRTRQWRRPQEELWVLQ
jgi:hypothetical protein